MKQYQILIGLALAMLCVVAFGLWLNERGKQRSTIEKLNKRVSELTCKIDDAKQKRAEEVDSFLNEYEPVFTMLRERELFIYRQMIQADSNILARVEDIRARRNNGVRKKWEKYRVGIDNIKLMEGRMINMLKGEIRYCEHHIRIVSDGEEDQNEYSKMLKTYPKPLFFESDTNAAKE